MHWNRKWVPDYDSKVSYTYNTAIISMKIVDNFLRLPMPNENVPAVTPTDNKLTLWSIEIDAFNYQQ